MNNFRSLALFQATLEQFDDKEKNLILRKMHFEVLFFEKSTKNSESIKLIILQVFSVKLGTS